MIEFENIEEKIYTIEIDSIIELKNLENSLQFTINFNTSGGFKQNNTFEAENCLEIYKFFQYFKFYLRLKILFK